MTYQNLIYDWVKKNYGQSEADDPSWNIKALADYLADSTIDTGELNAETKVATHSAMEQAYLEADIRDYAEGKGIDLTERQVRSVATEVRFSEWYCSLDSECVAHYIDEELGRKDNV